MRQYKNLRNNKYGKLTVMNEDPIRRNNQTLWRCRCECGNEKYVFLGNLKSGKTVSCGCATYQNRKRKKYINKKLMNTLQNMKKRCYDKNNGGYKNYGARGIKICDEWLENSENFYKWSRNNGFDDSLGAFECTIDRIDVNGNYEPNNCRWVTMKVQQNNRRNNRKITINGKTMTMSQWAEEYGVTRQTFSWRCNKKTR